MTDARIRDYQPPDAEAVVALALRAWARRVYERADYTLIPMTRYCKAL